MEATTRPHIDKAAKHLEALRKLAKSDDPDVREMAANYIGWIEKVQQAAQERQRISGVFEAYLKRYPSPKSKAKELDFTVRKSKVLMTKRTISKGELAVEKEGADNTALFKGRSMRDGEQYEIDFGDGITAVYRPWSDKNHYAQQGEFELVLPDRPDPKTLDKALEHIDRAWSECHSFDCRGL